MINRRIIRGKVLQQLFAYKTCEAANLDIVQEMVIQHFSPILNHEFAGADTKKMEGYSKLTLVSLEEYARNPAQEPAEAPIPEIKQALSQFIATFSKLNTDDKKLILQKMIADTEKILDYYLQVLLLLIETAHKIEQYKNSTKLSHNPLIKTLKEHKGLQQEFLKRQISWANDQDIVNALMASVFESDVYKIYENGSFEDERKTLLVIAKQLILKNPTINDYFEALDLHWEEDKIAVKDMVDDTIKAITDTGTLQVATVSKNWQEDKQFMIDLFEHTLKDALLYETYIQPQLKNWDISRLTGTDGILMKMCLAEMIHFPNIPVKVSINEYIEISKRYSTPKSKTLINGVLDTLSQRLITEKIIRKSGRGLMDNK